MAFLLLFKSQSETIFYYLTLERFIRRIWFPKRYERRRVTEFLDSRFSTYIFLSSSPFLSSLSDSDPLFFDSSHKKQMDLNPPLPFLYTTYSNFHFFLLSDVPFFRWSSSSFNLLSVPFDSSPADFQCNPMRGRKKSQSGLISVFWKQEIFCLLVEI